MFINPNLYLSNISEQAFYLLHPQANQKPSNELIEALLSPDDEDEQDDEFEDGYDDDDFAEEEFEDFFDGEDELVDTWEENEDDKAWELDEPWDDADDEDWSQSWDSEED